jgi:hypothetical protein
MRSPISVWSLCLALTATGAVLADAQRLHDVTSKASLPRSGKAVSTAGNGIYTLYVDDSGVNCGTWTATRGAGPGLNVLFGGGVPGTSYTTLRSYSSGLYYVTGSRGTGCNAICSFAAPVVIPILSGLPPNRVAVIGYDFVWSFTDGTGPAIQLEQEVVVEGPVDATANVENSAVRETHTVRNLGPGSFVFGLRKQWDWQIADNDGPYFGTCADLHPTTAACDVSMNLTPDGSLDGQYPNAYLMNADPAVTTCPTGVTPAGPNCGGSPPYLVAGTVAPPTWPTPPPDAPDLLQFNSWPALSGDCWQPALVNNATCGIGGDTAVAYFYGATAETAITLAPGESRSFTQYITAGIPGCPAERAIPTLNHMGMTVLLLMLLLSALVLLRRSSTVA